MNYSHPKAVAERPSTNMGSASLPISLPRVTVIVTCFNYARYIGQALDSVACQTYKNFDCVVVDDASTDESGRSIERWIKDKKDPRFRLISNASNCGQTASFVEGLAATSSEFVAFLDADDFWFPEFLQRHVEAQLNRSFSVSVSCSDMVQVDDEGRVLSGTWVGPRFEERHAHLIPTIDADHTTRIEPGSGRPVFLESPKVNYIYPSYLEYPWTATSGMMFRRSVLDLVMPKGPHDLGLGADCYLFVFCHYFTGSLVIGSALGAYRRHGNNNFGHNPVIGNSVMGTDLACAPSTITRLQQEVVRAMLDHLLDHHDRFTSVFANQNVRSLIRILFIRSLRENIPIRNSRLRSVLGTRGILEAKVKVKLSFIRRIALAGLRSLRMNDDEVSRT
jgi:glycosyltransferase involved in cell wall biosynthesis